MRPATLLTGLTLVGLLTACSQAVEVQEMPATPVRTETARLGPAAPPISASGSVAAKDELRLSFKVAGIVRRIAVQEGETVKRGQRLAEIELAEVNAQVEQARELAAKASRDLDRSERLYADEVITLEQLQDLRTEAAVASAQLDSARYNQGYAVITAPRDGVVLRRLAEERELVPAGQAVLVIGAAEAGYVVRAAIADREIVQLRLGDVATIRMDAYPGEGFEGEVSELAAAANERSGLFDIEVRLRELPPRLASGLVARITLTPSGSGAEQRVHVPFAAIVEGDRDRASVFVLVDGKVARRAVRIAYIGSDSVAIAEGLKAGETVVTDGALYLEDGERVAVVGADAAVVGSVALGNLG